MKERIKQILENIFSGILSVIVFLGLIVLMLVVVITD